jgi:hypothetical protein
MFLNKGTRYFRKVMGCVGRVTVGEWAGVEWVSGQRYSGGVGRGTV